ncbi:serine/threonine-protein kinase KIN2 [Thoreauomyces humboldtii]|nr:serine/threonine-protein kinase KIN2 [Thoreauomyces humboldtii]
MLKLKTAFARATGKSTPSSTITTTTTRDSSDTTSATSLPSPQRPSSPFVRRSSRRGACTAEAVAARAAEEADDNAPLFRPSPLQPTTATAPRVRRTLAERASFASLRERRAAHKQQQAHNQLQVKQQQQQQQQRQQPPDSASQRRRDVSHRKRSSVSSRRGEEPPPARAGAAGQRSPQTSLTSSSTSSTTVANVATAVAAAAAAAAAVAATAPPPDVRKNPHHHHARISKRVTTVGPYRLSKTLGQGSMGKVKLAIHAVTGEKRACKIIPRPASAPRLNRTIVIGPTKSISLLPIPLPQTPGGASESSREEDDSKEARIVREIAIMLLLYHPHIGRMYEVILQDDFYYLFLEYVDGGQMLDYMINHGKLKEKHARRFMRQIISAIDYCHQNSIVHRDLKIENVLIDKHGSIKLIDFGLSNMYAPDAQLETFCGSLYFAAPELLSARAYTGPEVDIWSLGVILYVLVCGRVPFDDVSMPVLHAKIKAGVVEYPSHLSEQCKHLISRLLVTNPKRRAAMSELKSHIWLTEGYEGPPKDYMPPREPLPMPLDPEVLSRIHGFEFGSTGTVTRALESHVASPANERISSVPVEPKASIYHLVREKMIREDLEAARAEGSDTTLIGGIPGIIDASAPPVSAVNGDDSVDIGSSSSSLTDALPAHQRGTSAPPSQRGRDSFQDDDRLSVPTHHHTDPLHGIVPASLPAPAQRHRRTKDDMKSTTSLGRMLRRLSFSFTRSSGGVSPHVPTPTTSSEYGYDYDVDQQEGQQEAPMPSAVSLPSDQRQARPNTVPSLRSRSSMASMYSTASTATTATTATNATQGRADRNIQTISLRHLMSTTTTTLSPVQIREVLTGVMDGYSRSQLRWAEMDAGFVCEFFLDDDEVDDDEGGRHFGVNVTAQRQPQQQQQQRPASPTVADVGTGGRSSHSQRRSEAWDPSEEEDDEAIFTAPVQLPKQPGGAARSGMGWARRLRKRSSSLWSLASTSSAASTDTTTTDGGNDGRSAVRFEIRIVKLPVVGGVHGIRFIRIAGDPWQYKALCSRILREASL